MVAVFCWQIKCIIVLLYWYKDCKILLYIWITHNPFVKYNRGEWYKSFMLNILRWIDRTIWQNCKLIVSSKYREKWYIIYRNK